MRGKYRSDAAALAVGVVLFGGCRHSYAEGVRNGGF